jgi:hypothetical protein
VSVGVLAVDLRGPEAVELVLLGECVEQELRVAERGGEEFSGSGYALGRQTLRRTESTRPRRECTRTRDQTCDSRAPHAAHKARLRVA